MKEKDIISLSKIVMDKLLNRDHNILIQLYYQYNNSKIVRVESTTVGFYVIFSVSDYVNSIKNVKSSFYFGDINGTVEGLCNGIGFVVHVKDGKLSFLECYTYDEILPKSLGNINLFFRENNNLKWMDKYFLE